MKKLFLWHIQLEDGTVHFKVGTYDHIKSIYPTAIWIGFAKGDEEIFEEK